MMNTKAAAAAVKWNASFGYVIKVSFGLVVIMC